MPKARKGRLRIISALAGIRGHEVNTGGGYTMPAWLSVPEFGLPMQPKKSEVSLPRGGAAKKKSEKK